MNKTEIIQYVIELKEFMKNNNIKCIYDGRNMFDTLKMMKKTNTDDVILFYWSDKNDIGYKIQPQ
jgi:hypothetical protein